MSFFSDFLRQLEGHSTTGDPSTAMFPEEVAARRALAIPSITDSVILARQFERKQQLAALKGRMSTFLTGPRGIGAGLPTSDMASAFLQASIREPQPTVTPDASKVPPSWAYPKGGVIPLPKSWAYPKGGVQ